MDSRTKAKWITTASPAGLSVSLLMTIVPASTLYTREGRKVCMLLLFLLLSEDIAHTFSR